MTRRCNFKLLLGTITFEWSVGKSNDDQRKYLRNCRTAHQNNRAETVQWIITLGKARLILHFLGLWDLLLVNLLTTTTRFDLGVWGYKPDWKVL